MATYNRCVCFDVHQMSPVSSALKNHTELSGLVATQSFRHSLVCTLKTLRFFYAAVAGGENHQRLCLAVCWRHVAGIWGKLKHLPLFLEGWGAASELCRAASNLSGDEKQRGCSVTLALHFCIRANAPVSKGSAYVQLHFWRSLTSAPYSFSHRVCVAAEVKPGCVV